MTRRFVMLSAFEKQWEKIGLTDEDLRRLQQEILQNPKAGDVVQGTGGLRKIRFAFENRGKSGSARVAYVDFAVDKEIYLIAVYAKNEKTNLTKEERNNIKKLIENLKKL
ncbi:MAG: type II toxin-antitoxin system RelE/ParE family toxin [Ruminococcus sp.]|nr:type II toxin-antitoxin system RelE/ParE family toxin [Ruminococcus sp.]